MLCRDKGVLPPSEYFFATPSTLARRLFCYPLGVGEYACGPDYLVERDCYNSVLLLLVTEGRCVVRDGGQERILEPGQFTLVDCYQPHSYGTKGDSLKLLWCHFDGGASRALAAAAECASQPETFENGRTLVNRLLRHYRGEAPLLEADASGMLHSFLCSLVPSPPVGGGLPVENTPISLAARFLETHFAESISVKEAARAACVSESHLTRLFRTQTGCPPYEYLIRLRVDAAKRMLRQTDEPLAEIASACGFGTVSGFIDLFRAREGLSPGKFRVLPF